MNLELSRPMIEAIRAIGASPVTASDVGASPNDLIKLANRGFLERNRKPSHPNLYTITAKGEALVELLTSPIVFHPCEGMVKQIQTAVAAHFRIPLDEMWSQRRNREVAHPRQVAMYLARELTPLSLPSIGRRFGNRDHTTIMYGIQQVEKRIEADKDFALQVKEIRDTTAPQEVGDLAEQTSSNVFAAVA